MNSRERWTIYPLLLLAVGMGIKTRVMGVENVPSIGCQSLTINGHDGKPLVRIHANPANQGQIEFFSPQGKLLLAAGGAQDGNAGQMVVVGKDGKPQVEIGSDGHAGLVQTCGPDGLPQVMLRSSKRGGNVVAWRGDHKLLLMLGHDDADSGVFAIDAATGGRAVVPFATLPQAPVMKGNLPKAEEQPAPSATDAEDREPASADTPTAP